MKCGMAVPDWPTTYGYNMFLFPISKWGGGIFYEHTHRLLASMVGVLVVALTRWLGGRPACKPLIIIAITETLAGYGFAVAGAFAEAGGLFSIGNRRGGSRWRGWFGRGTSPPTFRWRDWAGWRLCWCNFRDCWVVCGWSCIRTQIGIFSRGTVRELALLCVIALGHEPLVADAC